MTASNWILNLLIWGMLAIGIFFGLRARIRRAQEEAKRDDELSKTEKSEQNDEN